MKKLNRKFYVHDTMMPTHYFYGYYSGVIDRLTSHIQNGTPYDRRYSLESTSLDWYGDYYIVYVLSLPLAVGYRGEQPFMFRSPYWNSSTFGTKIAKNMRRDDIDMDEYDHGYLDTTMRTRLEQLGIFVSFNTKPMKNKLRRRFPVLHIRRASTNDNPYNRICCHGLKEYMDIHHKYNPKIKFRNISRRGHYCINDCSSPEYNSNEINEMMNDDFSIPPNSTQNVTLRGGINQWYFANTGEEIKMEDIPSFLHKALEPKPFTHFTREIFKKTVPTTPLHTTRNRKESTMNTNTTKTTNVISTFDILHARAALHRFISVFNSTNVDVDASTQGFHPHPVRKNNKLAVIDLIARHCAVINDELNKEVFKSLGIKNTDNYKFYANFKKIIPVLKYLCDDSGIKKQVKDGLSSLEVYDFCYHFPVRRNRIREDLIPCDFSITFRYEGNQFSYTFSNDFSTFKDEGGEVRKTRDFIKYLKKHVPETYAKSFGGFDEI